MMDIERFTKQEIPVEIIDGFGPEEGEKAEPIAMGRQTIWGGAGKPPSREVMQAAAKAARSEMMERMRSSKTQRGQAKPQSQPRSSAQQSTADAGNDPDAQDRVRQQPGERSPAANRQRRSAGPRGAGNTNRGGDNHRNSNRDPAAAQGAGRGRRPPGGARSGSHDAGYSDEGFDDQRQPRGDAHLGTQFGRPKPARHSAQGSQPDPMRTSVDMMSGGRGGRGGRSGGGGGGGFRGGFSR